MKLDEALAAIESSETVEELRGQLDRIIADYGFACFAFVDIGHPSLDDPFTVATTNEAWDREYRSNEFVHSDPVIPIARRTNLPFTWSSVTLPEPQGRRKPGAVKTMDAARDHGFRDGLVIPFHYVDALGRMNSASCGFFWKDAKSRFLFTLKHKKHDLHIIMLYWSQKAMEIASRELNRRDKYLNSEGDRIVGNVLTDRERDALSWAGRGKTMSETATILTISDDTVETHLRNAMRKLGASNKTHAVVKAIYLGLIDI